MELYPRAAVDRAMKVTGSDLESISQEGQLLWTDEIVAMSDPQVRLAAAI